MDEYWLTSSMPEQRLKLQISLMYGVIPENVAFKRVALALEGVEMNWSQVTNVLANLTMNSILILLAMYCGEVATCETPKYIIGWVL